MWVRAHVLWVHKSISLAGLLICLRFQSCEHLVQLEIVFHQQRHSSSELQMQQKYVQRGCRGEWLATMCIPLEQSGTAREGMLAMWVSSDVEE